MSMYRVNKNKNNPFVQLDKRFLSNPNLSYKAKGLLSYLLSKPDDWKVYQIELSSNSTDGKDSVRSGIKELIDNGYIVRHQLRQSGKFSGYAYDVFETPKTEIGFSDNGKPATTNIDITNNELTNKEDINTSKLSLDGEFFEETKHIILTYFAKYKQTFGKQHPFLKKDKLLKVADIIQMQEYEQDDFDDMIDVYFGIYANNPEVDCNILHFASNRMLEILYCRSL